MSDNKQNKTWTDEAINTLKSVVGSESPVSAATVERAATALNVTTRSIAAKLRHLNVEVASLAKESVPTFSDAQGQALARFVNDNAGKLTYKEIAEQFPGGFTAKQIQGKLLALELTGAVKPAEKVEVAKTYTPAQEAEFVKLANAGSFIEDLAAAMGKSVNSVRGKALSLFRAGQLAKIPSQKESHAKNDVDAFDALGDKVATMTVAEIGAAIDKTDRGVRTMLTRRGINVADYKGADKKAKAEAKS